MKKAKEILYWIITAVVLALLVWSIFCPKETYIRVVMGLFQ